ncbi:MAG: hypothetical protein PVG38_14515 [Gammaproteobacteria bacterium]|jgi:hypothetical protein
MSNELFLGETKADEASPRQDVLIPTLKWMLLAGTLMVHQAVAESPGERIADKGGAQAPSGAPHEMSLEEISAKLDNPLSDLWMIWMQNDRMQYNGDASNKSRTIDVKYFEPVISIPMGDKWNLVNRPVITRIDAQVPDINLPEDLTGLGGTPGGGDFGGGSLVDIAEGVLNNADWDNESAWGDLIFLSMVAPQHLPSGGQRQICLGCGRVDHVADREQGPVRDGEVFSRARSARVVHGAQVEVRCPGAAVVVVRR